MLEFTTRVPARLGIEFGMIVTFKRAKNQLARYCIFHPDIPDSHGVIRPPFDGEVYVRTNEWDFFLGDTLWDPIEHMCGTWRMVIELEGKCVAEKSFEVHLERNPS